VRVQALEVDAPEFAAVLARLASVRQMLVLGMIERCRDRYYNTALVIAGGRVLGGYRKRFLTGGESLFTTGCAYQVFDRRGVRFGINICCDTQFSQAAAAVAAAGAQVLLGTTRSGATYPQDRDVADLGRRHRQTRPYPNRPRPDLRHQSGRPNGHPGSYRGEGMVIAEIRRS
jgi:predicted amidohydrolase